MKKLRKLGIWLLIFISALLQSCWYVKQGVRLVSIYSSARPIDRWLSDPSLSAEERAFLNRSREVRAFATESLGLAENANYTSYARVSGDYLANILSACAPDSFDQYLWDYPIVGKLPYKGFFDLDEAIAERNKFRAEGYDTMLRGVDAFSTLGFFADPLFSFMSSYSAYSIANLIIHEETHATIFLSGKGDFNENLASFVGDKGALAFVTARFGAESEELKSALDGIHDYPIFREKLTALHGELASMYSSTPERGERLARKGEIISAFMKRWRDEYSKEFLLEGYKRFGEGTVDNAYLATFQNYYSGQSSFDLFYKACGEDLVKMINAIKAMPKQVADPYKWMALETEKLSRPK